MMAGLCLKHPRFARSSLDVNFRSVSEPLPCPSIADLGSKAASWPHILNIVYHWIRSLPGFSSMGFPVEDGS